ncbi:2-hydroxyacid dehydrogenase [Streptomyces albidus (ex Kaewkla and Franco 2022)]|uniref:2-hydroxyacid dehydrogenase n=1 Tax=Streptomyces albidus (ex Kaewkla and Franco 2022) TaxID=722709 RepID=UPI0028159A55|nr:2-hydroxyacid dehydrogenase [Streptomyces albidus (ex Kaewkla and Franco 2022)]
MSATTNATPDGPALRVLVTDEIISRFEPELTSGGRNGHLWTMAAGKPDAEILAALPESDVLVCSGMSTAMAEAGAGLRLVHVTGAGCDGIPFDSLAPGVAVANTSHHGRSVAEHVLMCMMMLSRRVQSADRELRSGLWRTVRTDPRLDFGATLEGRTVGLIGFGEIGLRTARLVSAMGMRVRAVRRNPAAAVPDDVELDQVGGVDELPLLLAESDVVVVTAPLTEETRGLLGAEAFEAMKPGAILVNVARGPVVDEEAVFTALSSGAIAGAALDVWWDAAGEPGRAIPSRFPFEQLDNVVLTPHHSGHTRNTFEARARDIAGNVGRLASGRPLTNQVRPAAR